MEQIQIIGNIGREVAIVGTNGAQDAYFTVAVDKSYKKADGTKVEMTNWYTVWKQPGGVDKFLKKGTKVFIQGRLNMAIDNYNGKPSIKLSIQNPIIHLLGESNKTDTTNAPTAVTTAQATSISLPAVPPNSDEDLPF